MAKNPLREPSIHIVDVRGGFIVYACDDESTAEPRTEKRVFTTAEDLMDFIEEFFDFDLGDENESEVVVPSRNH